MQYTYLMVIGFDGSRAFINNRTGTEEYSYQLLKALAKIDHHNNYIIFLRPGINKKDLVYFPQNFKFELINFKLLWTQGGLALKTFNKKMDVLFVPSHTLPLIRMPYLKTVLTVHDLGSEYLPKFHQFKQRVYLSIMQKHQLKGATKIIAVSKATKDDLIKKIGIEEEKIKVVYEGLDENIIESGRSDIKDNRLSHFGIKKNSYLLFIGTIQPRKNLERVIKAFAEFLKVTRGPASSVSRRASSLMSFAAATRRDPSSLSPLVTNLVIAGSKGWLSDEIYKLPARLGIDDKVKFLGYINDKDKVELYKGALAFVFPSLFEGFGLPILEAQACGCPVLTSNVSSMPEIAGEGAVFVDPYSIDDIVKGMGKLQIKLNREKLIKAGFENIKRFSWEKCARETLKVLEDL